MSKRGVGINGRVQKNGGGERLPAVRTNWRERWGTVNGNGGLYKLVSSLLAAGIMFLSGWVWNMEGRVKTLETATEIRMTANATAIAEIRADVKEILRELRK